MKKLHVIFILLMAFSLFQVSCVPVAEKTTLKFIPTSNSARKPSSVSGSAAFVNFMKVMNDKCMSCHNSDLIGNYALLRTEDQWLKSGLVVAGDIHSSSIYLALKGPNASGTMPKNLPTLSDAEIKTIKDWIINAETPSGVFSGQAVRMGNRNYVNSVINHVFGKSNTTAITSGVRYNTLSEKKILYNFSNFQGSCDIYSVRINGSIPLSESKPADLNDDWCPHDASVGLVKIAKVKTPIMGRTNSVRMGYLTQVCEGQVAHLPSLEYAMATHHGWTTGDLAVTTANLEKAYQSFYPEHPIPPAFATALTKVADTTTINKDKWKWIYLTICLSAEWQAP